MTVQNPTTNKILITGANGFVGKHLTSILTGQGNTVFALQREKLHSFEQLKHIFEEVKPDSIYHLAAYGNHSYQDDIEQMIDVNLVGGINLLSASIEIPYKVFINISSSSVLLSHETFYSATKAGMERLANAYSHQFEKPIITVRPYSLYGVGEASHRFIPTVFRSCLENESMTLSPHGTHDWVYVTDFVEFLIHLSTISEDSRGTIYNYGTGVSTSNQEVVNLIEEITGKKANITGEGQARSYDTNTWKAENGFPNQTQLREGLIKYYESLTK